MRLLHAKIIVDNSPHSTKAIFIIAVFPQHDVAENGALRTTEDEACGFFFLWLLSFFLQKEKESNIIGYEGHQTLYEMDEDKSSMKLYHYKPDGAYGELISQRTFDTDGHKRWGSKSRSGIDKAQYYHQDGLGSTYKMTDQKGKTEKERTMTLNLGQMAP